MKALGVIFVLLGIGLFFLGRTEGHPTGGPILVWGGLTFGGLLLVGLASGSARARRNHMELRRIRAALERRDGRR